MQNNNALSDYRKIQAPPQLKERVLASCEELSKSGNVTKLNFAAITKTASAAACFIAVIALVLTLAISGTAPKLYINGENVKSQTAVAMREQTAAASARTSLPDGIRFELQISSPAVLRATGGTLYAVEKQSNQVISQGSAVYAEQDVLLIWDVSSEDIQGLALKITTENSEKSFVLDLDENGELYIAERK